MPKTNYKMIDFEEQSTIDRLRLERMNPLTAQWVKQVPECILFNESRIYFSELLG